MIAGFKSKDLVLMLDEGRHRTPVKLISADDHVCYIEFLESCQLLGKDAGAKAWVNPAALNGIWHHEFQYELPLRSVA